MAEIKILFLILSAIFVCHGIQETSASENPSQIHRTGYHFQPPKNWMNDPNGPLVYKGLYHLFYQFNPNGPDWGDIVWAHSTSKDLINWTPHKPAIFPSDKGDVNGCWSGSATMLPGGKPAILYTGINARNEQVQNLAVPKDLNDPYLLEWVKSPYNPLMYPTQENMINGSSFRDPTTAWKGPDGHWRVVIGNKRDRDHRGRAIIYRSRDFVRWTQAKHPLHSAKNTGMWECPDFFPVSTSTGNDSLSGLDTSVLGNGVKHVLKVSLDDTKHDVYTVGKYNVGKDAYVPDKGSLDGDLGLRYDYGKFYASKTFYDSLKGRRILWGWINESLVKEDYIEQGWSGVQAIPRHIWLDKSGKQLMQWPIHEVDALWGKEVNIANKLVNKGSTLEVVGITPAQADVIVSFDIPKSELNKAEYLDKNWTDPQLICSKMDASKKGSLGPFGLKVLATKDMQEYTAVFFRVFKKSQDKYAVLMCSDQSRSSLNTRPDKTPYGAFIDVDPLKEQLSLRTLIDNSIIESFGAMGKACITSRVYPTKAIGKDAHLYVFNNGDAKVSVLNLAAWSMKKAILDLKS